MSLFGNDVTSDLNSVSRNVIMQVLFPATFIVFYKERLVPVQVH